MPWPVILVLATALPAGLASAWAAGRLSGRPAPAVAMIAADLAVAGSALFCTPLGWSLAVSLVLGWSLALLAAVDLIALRLPDVVTWPLAGVGLAAAPSLLQTHRLDHLVGAAVGYAALAGIGWAYKRMRGREGLGLGDAKLCAGAGAWLGWEALPSLIVLASGWGLVWVAVGVLRGRRLDAAARLPFGPPLCAALWILWLLALASSRLPMAL